MNQINIEKENLVNKNNFLIIKYPYGQQDPYALVELVASTQVYGDKFVVDQMPALSARVSHAVSGKTGEDPVADEKLMNYLAQHQHMTPFEHQSITFKIVTPLFVAREWMRHRTQSFNEVSMRYSSDPVGKFYLPAVWRNQAKSNKQSSDGSVQDQNECSRILKEAYDFALKSYEALLARGVCREQARLVVPVGNYTQFYATANLRNWHAFYKLRIASDAQWEIRQFAKCIGEIIEQLWPKSWKALNS